MPPETGATGVYPMSASSSSDSTFNPREPIPGYVTSELIGRGGFGEVWKAEAPGGLAKAIKIVHAGVDSSRAERELRSLQRIRDVRHPLILSIERIEIIQGTLVIVTELADCSLRDVFKSQRDKKQPGIPRDQLLSMLRDVADALDYIYDEYSLQHLDIKPENLLVVGNRLKLGDFGLIKNIYERGASLVSGLTPTYAPPELFEGKPTRQSDQYSLAIVYQHMLTGELPFEGATPAQLAREHLAGVPRLSMLMKSERPIIARALAKSPGDRFESCTALIDQLEAAPVESADAGGSDHDPEVFEVSKSRTLSLSDDPPEASSHGATASIPNPGDLASADAGASIDPVLGALEASLQPTRRPGDTTSRRSEVIPGSGFVPTVLVGIGGSGGLVLKELRSQIESSIAPLHEIPSLQMVLLDTDGRSLNSLMHQQGLADVIDCAALPLRRPEDYKFRESGLSRWLHRRWVYNMPRSLATEGYRPLGRLALIDHCDRVVTSLKTAIGKAAASESAKQSATATGLPFRHGHVRVIIVASSSGATGSGMLLDVAYAVRGELKRRSLSDEDILAFLLHATPTNPSDRDKAVANSYALLSEIGHYSSPGHFYPGDTALDTPQFHGDNRTFRSAYLVDLGPDVDTARRQEAAAEIAEYLFLTSVTPAKMVVDASRHTDEARSDCSRTSVVVRSMCVHRFDHLYSPDVADATALACRDVVAMWASERPAKTSRPAKSSTAERLSAVDLAAAAEIAVDSEAERQARELLSNAGLEADALLQWARGLTDQIWQRKESDFLQQMFQEIRNAGEQQRLSRKAMAEGGLKTVDKLAGRVSSQGDDDEQTLPEKLDAVLSRLATEAWSRLSSHVLELVDKKEGGAGAAQSLTQMLSSQIQDLRNELERRRRACDDAAAEAGDQLRNGPPPGSKSGFNLFRRRRTVEKETLLEGLSDYATQRLDEVRLAALQEFLNQIHSQLGVLTDQLVQLTRELACLAAEFPVPEEHDPESHSFGPETEAFIQRVRESLQQGRREIALAVIGDLNGGALAGDRKLQRYLGGRSELQSSLKGPLIDAARRVIAACVRQTTMDWIAKSADESQSQHGTSCGRLVAEFLEERRAKTATKLDPVLVLVPEEMDPALLGRAFASCREARLVPARTTGITVFAEVTPRPLENVADELIQQQDLYRQLAQKLHTREDVDWSPLPPPRKTAGASASPSVHVHAGAKG